MLKQLRIQNIILIEDSTIDFSHGLNVISGETGSGKSAIMEALSLLAGDRKDSSIIRKGHDRGIVECLIEIEPDNKIHLLLEKAGIVLEGEQDLLIRREISSTGKGRVYINHQMAQLSLLKDIGSLLLMLVGQHANQHLFSLDSHREILDIYAELETDVLQFAQNYALEMSLRRELEQMMSDQSKRIREIEVCRIELEELQDANIKEDEEETLFAEYQLLAHADELTQSVNEIIHTLSHEKQGILPQSYRLRQAWDRFLKIDSSMSETGSAFQNALLELQEVAYTLSRYANQIEANPERMAKVEQRLSLIHKLKRKYGASYTEIDNYIKESQARLNTLENVDDTLADLQASIQTESEKNNILATNLTAKRQKAAAVLQNNMSSQLHALNMPKAHFSIAVSSQNRTRNGDDKIEFYLAANSGERLMPLRDCASGGELSRILLALQALLAGKEHVSTIVFDEIDANIGGTTANVIGEKLKEIGQRHQVLCITHFPQVAKYADHHLCTLKKEVDGRTITFVSTLDAKDKIRELARMQGS